MKIAVVALGGLLAIFAALFGRKAPRVGRAENVAEKSARAAQEALQQRSKLQEEVADAKLDATRAQDGSSRLAGALQRARQRRAGGPPPAGGSG